MAISKFKLALILGTLAALGPFSIDTYLPAFSTIVSVLQAPVWQIQWSIAIYFVGLALGQVFYGPLSDRIGRRRPLTAGLLMFIFGTLGCAVSVNGWELIAFRFIQALGGCTQMVISRAVVRDHFKPTEAAHFFSMMMLVSGLAPVLAPIVGGWLLVNLGWRSIFFFMALCGAAVLAACYVYLPESHPPERRVRHSIGLILKSYGGLMMDKGFMSFVISGGVVSGCLFAYISGAPFIYMEIYHVKPEHFGYFFAINALGLMAAGQANRYLLRRFDMRAMLRAGLMVIATAALLVGLQTATGWGGFPALLVPLCFCISCYGIIMPITTALAMAPHGAVAGYAAALLGTLQFLLSGIAGMAVGSFSNGTAVPMGAVIAFCGVSGLALNLWLVKGARQETAR